MTQIVWMKGLTSPRGHCLLAATCPSRGPVLLGIFISDLDENISYIFVKYTFSKYQFLQHDRHCTGLVKGSIIEEMPRLNEERWRDLHTHKYLIQKFDLTP